jgi:hypothetical protein
MRPRLLLRRRGVRFQFRLENELAFVFNELRRFLFEGVFRLETGDSRFDVGGWERGEGYVLCRLELKSPLILKGLGRILITGVAIRN